MHEASHGEDVMLGGWPPFGGHLARGPTTGLAPPIPLTKGNTAPACMHMSMSKPTPPPASPRGASTRGADMGRAAGYGMGVA